MYYIEITSVDGSTELLRKRGSFTPEDARDELHGWLLNEAHLFQNRESDSYEDGNGDYVAAQDATQVDLPDGRSVRLVSVNPTIGVPYGRVIERQCKEENHPLALRIKGVDFVVRAVRKPSGSLAYYGVEAPNLEEGLIAKADDASEVYDAILTWLI